MEESAGGDTREQMDASRATEERRSRKETPEEPRIATCIEIAQSVLEKVHRGVLALRQLGEQQALRQSSRASVLSSPSSSCSVSSSSHVSSSLSSVSSCPPPPRWSSSSVNSKPSSEARAPEGVKTGEDNTKDITEEGQEGAAHAPPGKAEGNAASRDKEEGFWDAFLERVKAPPHLVAVTAGKEDAGVSFLRSQKRAAEASGVRLSLLELDGSISLRNLRDHLRCLGGDAHRERKTRDTERAATRPGDESEKPDQQETNEEGNGNEEGKEEGKEGEEGDGLTQSCDEATSGRKSRPEDGQTETGVEERKRARIREKRSEIRRHLKNVLRELEDEAPDCVVPFAVPCVALAVLEILKAWKIPLPGASAAVVGASPRVGQAIALLLLQEQATVTLCHSRTKQLGEILKRSDVIIAAAGSPNLISADSVRRNAAVIDVGVSVSDKASRAKGRPCALLKESENAASHASDARSERVGEGQHAAPEETREKGRDEVPETAQARGEANGEKCANASVREAQERKAQKGDESGEIGKSGESGERRELERERGGESRGRKARQLGAVLVGDVDFHVKKKTRFLTPVPRGVGLVTGAVLMRQVLKAKILQLLRSLQRNKTNSKYP
ncbi:GI23694, related [Neospora caninum Liverpool]|uniref:methenyltetrahydrofolate cyclohydrolase n=1 Tax=Neospora caninum (strain Liverpool) TaxID=572307 RepID=F0VHG5_NEOCL|nr:GI23694, related [Neospora caninum Liverpool]CBZ53159.1 GI23694, related [Neospora caninum Liverpool]|eukprot:XP_003883191.1 GI23694, related [Neospora caninum Liverpool]